MVRWLVAVSGMLAFTFGIAAGQQEDPGASPVLPSSDVVDETDDATASRTRPAAPDSMIVAATTTADIQLDGELDEAVWAAADSIYIFRQREPTVGASFAAPTRRVSGARTGERKG
jgi:hypothetical protein